MERKHFFSVFSFLFLAALIFWGQFVETKTTSIFNKEKPSNHVWRTPKAIEGAEILMSLKTKEEEKSQNITEDKVKEIIKAQNDILKEEMKKQKIEIKEEINKTIDAFNDKLNESTLIIKTMIKNNHKKIKNALRKLEYQIKETSKESDDVAAIIIGKEIAAKKKKKEDLEKEIERLENDLPEEFLDQMNKSNCTGHLSCNDCTQNAECGWCNMYQLCVDGDQYGPFLAVCSFYSYDTCNDNDCNNYNNCDDCINNPLCGWCKDMVNNVEGCLNENKDNPVCPYEGWIQLGTKKNLCEFADRFKKTDFLNEASKMSQEEKNLQIIQKRKTLEIKKKELEEMSNELSELNKKMEDLKKHYSENNPNNIDPNDELDEFELDDCNKNKTLSGNNTLSNQTTNNTLIENQESNKLDSPSEVKKEEKFF